MAYILLATRHKISAHEVQFIGHLA